MHIKALSATAIRDFLQCPLKLVFRYDRGLLSEKNDNAKLGSAVHEALEQFSRRMLAKKSFPDASDYDFAVTTFMHSATEAGLEQMYFYTEGRKMVTEFIDRFDPSEKILDLEHLFRITTPEGIPIVGAIDKVIEIDENTLGIIDYKTARNAMTPYELKDDIQLSMYDLAASLIWPQYENRILFLEYVRIDKKVKSYRTEEARGEFGEFLSSIWTQLSKLNETEVRGRINRFCGWCDYKAYCNDHASFIQSKSFEAPPIAEMGDEEFIQHWEQVSEMKTVIESRQRELKMAANERFIRGDKITAGGKELYSMQQARTNYDVEQVADVLPGKDLLSVLNVNKARLDRYAKDDPELKNKLARIANVNYTAPMYKTRAIKEEEVIDGPANRNESAA